jgi:hypothetical protein
VGLVPAHRLATLTGFGGTLGGRSCGLDHAASSVLGIMMNTRP